MPRGGLLHLQAKAGPDLLPFPLTDGNHDNALFSPGPVVSSKSSFTFFFCFPPSPSSYLPLPHPPPSQNSGHEEESQEQGKESSVPPPPRLSGGLRGSHREQETVVEDCVFQRGGTE